MSYESYLAVTSPVEYNWRLLWFTLCMIVGFLKMERRASIKFCTKLGKTFTEMLKLAIHLSFLVFWHVHALFRELCEIANQSLYTSHNITDFVHLWFCEELDEKLSLSPLWRFVKIQTVWRERQNARWEKWLARWFTKCHLYTYRFSHFANIFSHSRQFDDKCIAGLRMTDNFSRITKSKSLTTPPAIFGSGVVFLISKSEDSYKTVFFSFNFGRPESSD